MCGLAQDFARRVKGDVLVGVAGPRFALERRVGEVGAQERRVLPALQPVIIGVLGKTRLLGEQLLERDMRLGAARQMQRRTPRSERAAELDAALTRHRGGEHARYGLRNRGPAEQGPGGDRRPGRPVGEAIGAHEAQLAVLDHRDRKPRHFGTPREVRQLPVERLIIDPAAPFGRRVGEIFGGFHRNRDAGERLTVSRGVKTEPAEPKCRDRNGSEKEPQSGLVLEGRPHIRSPS